MRLPFLATAAMLAVTASAQNWYVPDSSPLTGFCNVVPFGGATTTSSFHQCKYQMKVSAADLGNTPGLITGLGFVPCSSGMARFGHLEVVISHHPANVPLDTTFANNLSPGAVTVIRGDDYIWHLTADVWTELGVQNRFSYDGVRDIVIQITTVDATSPGGFHRGAQSRVSWNATSGTAPATGSADNLAAKVEVGMIMPRLSTYGLGCTGSNGRPSHTLTGSPRLNQTVFLNLENGLPNGAAASIIGFYSDPPYPLDLTPFGMPGCSQYIDMVSNRFVPLDALGNVVVPLFFPNSPWLVNVKMMTQYACYDPATNPVGATTSGYGRIFIAN